MDIIDSHFHIIGARDMEPSLPFAPPPFTVDTYLQVTDRIDGGRITGGVVVGGSKNERAETLLESLEQLELEARSRGFARADGRNFIGMITGTADLGAERVLTLHAAGVRGIRFNLLRGQPIAEGDLLAVAEKVHDIAGWTTDIAVDIAERPDLADALVDLPAVCINHLGVSGVGVPKLVELASRGVRVKATGFGRIDFAAADALDKVHRANPEALMFGTDLPGTRAQRRFEQGDVDLLVDVLGEWEMRRIMHDNAADFYDFSA